jgi:hypothetical protein
MTNAEIAGEDAVSRKTIERQITELRTRVGLDPRDPRQLDTWALSVHSTCMLDRDGHSQYYRGSRADPE